MKKITAITLFMLVLGTMFVFANDRNDTPKVHDKNYMSIGASYNRLNQKQELSSLDYKESYKAYGINLTTFTGSTTGMYAAVNYFFVNEMKGESGTQSITISDMDSVFDNHWGMDALFGIARRTWVNETTMTIIGAGLNYSQAIFTSDYSSFAMAIAGIGGVIEVASELDEGFYLSGSIRAGYNFVPVFGDLKDDNVNFTGGFSFAPSVGVSVTY